MALTSMQKATTHEPVGTRPLWKHKGWQLPAYIQHIANDLREKRGMTESRAIATAISVVKRWATGAGNVKPETRAAAAKAVAEWEKLKAKAAASRAGKASMSEMEDPIVSPIEFSEEDFADYSTRNLQGGFSPGTANVSAEDYQKLLPMLRYYAKQPHPFQACYADVKEEFGDNAERYAALIKDLIYHSTAWRNPSAEKDMQPVVLAEHSEWDAEDFLALAEFVTELRDKDALLNEIDLANTKLEVEGIELAQAPTNIGRLETIASSLLDYLKNEKDMEDRYEARSLFQRVHALIAKDRADSAMRPLGLSEGEPWMAEMFFDAGTGDAGEVDDEKGVIWKTIMREGRWKLSPGPGQRPMKRPITVISKGKSDPAKLVISMSELMNNFKDRAVEHVTIPTSHDNKVVDNTGFIRALRMKKDENGRTVLEAAHDFTEPDVEGKARRGTIANTSAGVLFDYPRKEDGKTYRAVLEHVALTNKPWLSGMRPFGLAANNEEVKTVVTFSEEVELSDEELEALMSEETETETPAEETPAEETDDGNKDDVAAEGEADVETTAATEGEEVEKPAEETPKEADLGESNVTYADPGYQSDGTKRYPLDSEKHCRAAWAYVNKSHNAAEYTAGQLKKVKARIRAALKKYNVAVAMSDERLTKENMIVLLSQEVKSKTTPEGGNEMPEEMDYVERFGMSEDELEEALKEREALKKAQKTARVEAKLSEWTEAKKSPAILEAAEAFLLSDDGTTAVEVAGVEGEDGRFNLSEDKKAKKVGLTLSDVVEKLVELSPAVNLEDKKVTEKETTEGTRPEEKDEESVELSADIAARARHLFLYEGLTEEDAIAKAKADAEKTE